MIRRCIVDPDLPADQPLTADEVKDMKRQLRFVARYKAVLDVLEGVDFSWTSLVEHSTALSWSGRELKVAFRTEFQLREGKPKITGAAIRPLLERAFPGLTRVEVVLREQPQGRPETRHEARKTDRARYLSDLRKEVEDDAVISRLRRDLELELDNFIPKDPREIRS